MLRFYENINVPVFNAILVIFHFCFWYFLPSRNQICVSRWQCSWI